MHIHRHISFLFVPLSLSLAVSFCRRGSVLQASSGPASSAPLASSARAASAQRASSVQGASAPASSVRLAQATCGPRCNDSCTIRLQLPACTNFAFKLTGKRDTQGQETEQCRNTSYNCASMYEGTTNDAKIDTVLPGVG